MHTHARTHAAQLTWDSNTWDSNTWDSNTWDPNTWDPNSRGAKAWCTGHQASSSSWWKERIVLLAWTLWEPQRASKGTALGAVGSGRS